MKNIHFCLLTLFCLIATYSKAHKAEDDLLSVIKFPERCYNNYVYSNNNFNRFDTGLSFNSNYLPASSIISDTAENGNKALDRISNFPDKFLTKANGKISVIRKHLEKQSEKYISKLLKQESKLREKFLILDSSSSESVFSTNSGTQYTSLLEHLKSDTTIANLNRISGEYYPYIDSLQTALSYLVKTPNLTDASKIAPEKIESTLKNLLLLQSKMQDADQIKQFIQQRKEQIKQYINQYTHLAPGIIKLIKVIMKNCIIIRHR